MVVNMGDQPTPPVKEARFYALRTTVGQERNVALIIETKAKAKKTSIKSILVVDGLKGFVFVEADTPFDIDQLTTGMRYVKGRMGGVFRYQDIERFVRPKPVIEDLRINDIIEVVSGPFRGMRGRVVDIGVSRGEIRVEILEAAYPLSITINADYVRLVERQGGQQEK